MVADPILQAVENETNEAVYVKDGLMTWEVFQQALLLISLPLAGALLALGLVFLSEPQLTNAARMIPHSKYDYQKKIKECETLWEQRNLVKLQDCIHQADDKLIKFAKLYEKVKNSEQVALMNELSEKIFLDVEPLNKLKQKYDIAVGNKVATSSPSPSTNSDNATNQPNIPNIPPNKTTITPNRESVNKVNVETIDIYNMTNINEILKWCLVLKSQTVANVAQIKAPECYKRILQLDPGNYVARRSIRSIKAKYTQRAIRALSNAETGKISLGRALDSAKTNIDRVKAIDPDDDVLANLIERYKELETQHQKRTLLDDCYKILDSVEKNEDINDEDKIFIEQNCPSSVVDEMRELIRSNSSSFVFEIEEE